MKPVHVLDRQYGADDRLLVDLFRQRQLDEDAMHVRLDIEALEQVQQLRFGRVGRQVIVETGETGLVAGLDIAADVEVAGVVVADLNVGPAWYGPDGIDLLIAIVLDTSLP